MRELEGQQVYIAHPLGQGVKRETNRRNAALWCAYLAKRFLIAPSCAWIVLSGVWPETDELRELGLKLDCYGVEWCNELWLVGGRISAGMLIEAEHALKQGVIVRDLTWVGYDVPISPELAELPFALPEPTNAEDLRMVYQMRL